MDASGSAVSPIPFPPTQDERPGAHDKDGVSRGRRATPVAVCAMVSVALTGGRSRRAGARVRSAVLVVRRRGSAAAAAAQAAARGGREGYGGYGERSGDNAKVKGGAPRSRSFLVPP